MKTLRLTIALEPGLSKAALANVFGHYEEIKTQNHRYVQFKFPSVKMLGNLQLKPIHALLQTFEIQKPLTFKMFHLQDETDNSCSPTRVMYWQGSWTLELQATDKIIAKGRTLFDLF